MGAENSLGSPDYIIRIYQDLGAYITIIHSMNTDNIIIHMKYRDKELEQELKGIEYRVNQTTFLNAIDEMYQKLKIADTIAKKMLGEDTYDIFLYYEGTMMYNPTNHNKLIINLTDGLQIVKYEEDDK